MTKKTRRHIKNRMLWVKDAKMMEVFNEPTEVVSVINDIDNISKMQIANTYVPITEEEPFPVNKTGIQPEEFRNMGDEDSFPDSDFGGDFGGHSSYSRFM